MTIAHIYNGELGFDVRTKLNALIDQVAAIPAGTGDVVGPASAIADHIAVYNGITGKLIKDGGQTIAQVIAAAGGGGMVIGDAVSGGTVERVLFTGAGGILADDSYFTWDYTNNVLNLQNGTIQAWGGFYLAFMDNPNVSANYFAGGSGHPGYTTSGAILNVGLGPYALGSIISGSNNLAIGGAALEFLTSGSDNVAIGANAIFRYDGSKTIAIGSSAGGGARTSGDSNIFIGYSAASSISNTSAGNVWLGGYTGTAAVFSNTIVFSDGAGTLKAACGYSNAGWTLAGSPKAGAPANTDLPSGFFSVIDDTSGGATWLVLQ